MFFIPSIEVNGLVPWMSQVISLNTVRNVLMVTNRTPASISRRGQQAALAEAVMPYFSRSFFGSLRQVERLPGFGAGHHAEGGLEVAVHQLRPTGWLEDS
jgi:hypothetical protein